MDFKLCNNLNIDSSISDQLTANPREIILAYPQTLETANPDWDDLIEAQEDNEEDSEGMRL
jgi:hypothetical protein